MQLTCSAGLIKVPAGLYGSFSTMYRVSSLHQADQEERVSLTSAALVNEEQGRAPEGETGGRAGAPDRCLDLSRIDLPAVPRPEPDPRHTPTCDQPLLVGRCAAY